MKKQWVIAAFGALMLAARPAMVTGIAFDEGANSAKILKTAQDGKAGASVTGKAARLETAKESMNSSQAMAAWVKKNVRRLEKRAAKELSFKEISIDEDSIQCLATDSRLSDEGWIGACLAEGDLDYPNSSSVFQISVREEEGETMIVTISVLSTEI